MFLGQMSRETLAGRPRAPEPWCGDRNVGAMRKSLCLRPGERRGWPGESTVVGHTPGLWGVVGRNSIPTSLFPEKLGPSMGRGLRVGISGGIWVAQSPLARTLGFLSLPCQATHSCRHPNHAGSLLLSLSMASP